MSIPVQTIDHHDYQHAVELLKQGHLVVFPTETVYGLGADASNPDAVNKIFALKGRPADHPVIVHIAANTDLSNWAAYVSPVAQRLMDKFWPGPLTLIFKKSDKVLPHVTGGQDTVGIRCPDHPVTQALLKLFGDGLAGPSANPFGRISPTTVDHVLDGFKEGIALVLDGGPCEVGIESTIVDVSQPDFITILRPGRIRPSELVEVAGVPVLGRPQGTTEMRVSGNLSSHYAPVTCLEVVPSELLESQLATHLQSQKRVGLWAFNSTHLPVTVAKIAPTEVQDYEHELYAMLHEFDHLGLDVIVFEEPPKQSDWEALFDRLKRAGRVLVKPTVSGSETISL